MQAPDDSQIVYSCKWDLTKGSNPAGSTEKGLDSKSICSSQYASPEELHLHIATVHVKPRKELDFNTRELQCQWQNCPLAYKGKPFKKRDQLLTHIRIHCSFPKSKCDDCGSLFTWTHDLRKHRLRHHSADGTREKSTVDTVAEVQKRNLNLNLNPTCTQLNTPQTPKALAFPSLLPVQSQEPPRANSQTAQRLHNPYFLHQSQHSYQPYAVPRQVHSNEQFLVENRVGWLQTRHQSQRRTIFEPQFCQLPPNYVPDNAFDQRAGRRVKYVPIMLPPSPQRRPEYQRPVYMSYREFVIDQ